MAEMNPMEKFEKVKRKRLLGGSLEIPNVLVKNTYLVTIFAFTVHRKVLA